MTINLPGSGILNLHDNVLSKKCLCK